MKRLILLFAVCILQSNLVFSQEYIEEEQNRLNFAKTYFELGAQLYPSFNSYTSFLNNTPQAELNSSLVVPYLNIGGLHFWGHADFYISVPLLALTMEKDKFDDFRFDHSVITGMRYLPWAYKDNAIRPYIGGAWTVAHFQSDRSDSANYPLWSKNQLNADLGVVYGSKNIMMRLGLAIYPVNSWDYPVSSTRFETIKTPGWGLQAGVVYSMETTKTEGAIEEHKKLNAYDVFSSPKLDADKKGDLFIALGPSTSFSLRSSSFIHEYYPFLNEKPISKAFLDYGVGYHLNERGIVLAMAYRNISFENNGFGVSNTVRKKSLLFEAYKYLTDYNGFTPYIGLNLSYSSIESHFRYSGGSTALATYPLHPGLTFGWDILPGKTQQRFVLRTNLRWFPFNNAELMDYELNFNQLEYNVIQLVFYPFR